MITIALQAIPVSATKKSNEVEANLNQAYPNESPGDLSPKGADATKQGVERR